MNISRIAYVSILVFVSMLVISAQEYTYSNEIKGFEIFKRGKWKSLKPFVSTKEDVIKIFGQDCSKLCDYDENWRFQVIYVGQCSSYSESKKAWVPRVDDEMLGKYSNIIFYPKKQIKHNKLRFGKDFSKFQQEVSHSLPRKTIIYTNNKGLIYKVAGENVKGKYQKGDLVLIIYSWIDSEYEKYKPKINCETNT